MKKIFIVLLSGCLILGCTSPHYPLDENINVDDQDNGSSSVDQPSENNINPLSNKNDGLPSQGPFTTTKTDCEHMDYTLGPEDQLTVIVSGKNEYTLVQDATIGTDGTFIFELLGEINAAGLTITQLEKSMQIKLAEDFLVDPQVSISITKYKSHKVYVSGEVNSPGEYIIKKECAQLSEVILEAGGLRGNFRKDAFIIRANSQEANRDIEMTDLYQLLIEGKKSLDVVVYDKDIIQVFDKGENIFGPQNSIFIFGEVEKPGMYPYSDDLTVLSAILIYTGGFLKTAKKSRVEVVREENKEVKSMIIDIDEVMQGKKDLDILLKPGDIIHVPRTFF